MSNGGGPLLAIFARGGCEQRRIYSGYRRVPRPSFFEGWDSTVRSRVGFPADSCTVLVNRIAARLLTPRRRYPICRDSSFQFLSEKRDIGRDAALVLPESLPEARR